MVKYMMVLLVSLMCAELASGGNESTVTTTERIGLAYNQFDVVATVVNPSGVTAVKVVLKDGQGQPTAVQTSTLSEDVAIVKFLGLTPGASYSYDVILVKGGEEVEPAGWETRSVNLYSTFDWFGFESGVFCRAIPDANIEIKGSSFASKNDELGIVTPEAEPIDQKAETVLDVRISVQDAYAWCELPTLDNSQIALCLALRENETKDIPPNRVWAYKFGSGSWSALTESNAPIADGTYDIRIILDYQVGKASCRILSESIDYMLVEDVPLTAGKMDRFGVIGGNVISQNAGFRMTSPVKVQPTGTEIALEASSEVDLSALEADTSYTITDNGYALCWQDMANRYATKSGSALMVHTGAPANGLESFSSYALGLDPTVTLAKPAAVVKEGGMQSADGVTVHVPNVVKANLPDAGVEVLFQRQKSVDGGKNWMDDGEPAKVGGELTIPFTPETLYRVNTVLK